MSFESILSRSSVVTQFSEHDVAAAAVLLCVTTMTRRVLFYINYYIVSRVIFFRVHFVVVIAGHVSIVNEMLRLLPHAENSYHLFCIHTKKGIIH